MTRCRWTAIARRATMLHTTDPGRPMRILLPVMLFVLPLPSALAQHHNAIVDPQQSSVLLDLDATMSNSGHLIGDFDAATNPTGTQTRPGVFGGSGNNPIPVSVVIEGTAAHQDAPAGLFDMNLGLAALQLTVSGLALDLMPSGSAPMLVDASATFETFNTINPGFIYPGGTPVSLPLGDAAEISALVLTQTAPAVGQLQATPDADVFAFTLQMDVELAFVVRISLPDTEPTEVPMDSLPLVLPLAGTLDRSQPGSLLVDLLLEPESISGAVPVKGLQLPPVPLELPTLTADTASVILHLQADSLPFDGSLGMLLHAVASSSGFPDAVFSDGFE